MPENEEKIHARNGIDAASIQRGYAEHLKYDLARDRYTCTRHDRYLALALAVRDRLIARWIATQQSHHIEKVKRVYYLSLEFLLGRLMGSNVINLGIEKEVRQALADLGLDWDELREEEIDAGLGNGGLGRLAACFLDSLATLQIPAMGYGLRYDYGIFRQAIQNGYQTEEPDEWLRWGNPWEIARPDFRIPVHFGGRVEVAHEGGSLAFRWHPATTVIGIPYDTPIVGYGGNTVNTLRLFSAKAAEEFDFQDFNKGDYVAAVENKIGAETLTKVLYPNDCIYIGKELRFRQQYFFVACALWDIFRRFKADKQPWTELPNRAAIQMNDTHPALCVPEMMRLLVDIEGVDWDTAWEITQKCLAYTNHTLLPEALETWPVPMFESLLPRHLQIIYEINHRFLQRVAVRFPGNMEKLARLSIIGEGDVKHVRMANLCVLGSHSTNGVSALHTELLRRRVLPDFAEMFPERFNNKTNGITPRRWLLKANPPLAALITETIGDRWITDLDELRKLAPLADDAAFRSRFRKVKRQAKVALADYLKKTCEMDLDPDTIFDVQVKRLHEYKRQMLNALHVVMLYLRLKKNPNLDMQPRTFIFGAKAAPGYQIAKLIIKFINNIATVINHDLDVNKKLRVYFVPNYRVSLAERIIPAADVSEQISTAGTEASGTGNMKFMLNGALTLGTLDGANIEILEEVGKDNIFIFGLTAEQVAELRPRYNPAEIYRNNSEIREACDIIFKSNLFCISEPHIFAPLYAAIFEEGDRYMHLADLSAYAEAQNRIDRLYRDQEEWSRKAILNIAHAGKFSSDRTIMEYAREIWGVASCPVNMREMRGETIADLRRATPPASG